jgi:sulfate transport system substrate-binding protein
VRRAGPLLALLLVAAACEGGGPSRASGPRRALLNVSFDPTRELLRDYGAWFAREHQRRTGEQLELRTSHGGSGRQARAVIDGLEADLVSLALASDLDAIAAQARLLPADWRERLPARSSPFTSAVVFVVRAGNPKGIAGWDDLLRSGVEVVVPNPKSSGGGRLAYAAAFGQALLRPGGSAAAAERFVTALYQHVPLLDSGARAASTSFLERGLGDVLLTWESEALLLTRTVGRGRALLVRPERTVLAEPPVALVEPVAARHGNEQLARDYLLGLFSPEGQELAARHHYRPRDLAALERHRDDFPPLPTFTIEEALGEGAEAQQRHFDPGGLFDRVLAAQEEARARGELPGPAPAEPEAVPRARSASRAEDPTPPLPSGTARP